MRIAFLGGTFIRRITAISRSPAPPSRGWRSTRCCSRPGTQPLKGGSAHSSFEDRLAMVRLAVAGEPGLTASAWTHLCPAASPTSLSTPCNVCGANFTRGLLFCLVGADSFLTLKRWHQCAELLLFCDFIVAGRPGFSLEQINAALPKGVKNTANIERLDSPALAFPDLGDGVQHCFCYPAWTRTSLPPRFVRHGLTARSSKPFSLRRWLNTFAPTASIAQ